MTEWEKRSESYHNSAMGTLTETNVQIPALPLVVKGI